MCLVLFETQEQRVKYQVNELSAVATYIKGWLGSNVVNGVDGEGRVMLWE